jgi:hypothetical protein
MPIGQSVRVTKLLGIGYWNDGGEVVWPDPEAFIDLSWDAGERARVVSYLQAGTVLRRFFGYSTCRVCGIANGDAELSDGTYMWPDGLAHYLSEHGVRLPTAFVEHAMTSGSASPAPVPGLDGRTPTEWRWWHKQAIAAYRARAEDRKEDQPRDQQEMVALPLRFRLDEVETKYGRFSVLLPIPPEDESGVREP